LGTGFAGNANSFISLPDDARLKPSAKLSVAIWVRPDTTAPQEQYLVFTANNDSTDLQAYALSIRNGKFRGYKNAVAPTNPSGGPSINVLSAVVDSSTNVQNNTWYHVALTISASEIQLYVNGVLEATTSAAHALDYKVGAAVIVGGTNEPTINGPFEGSLSTLRFYNRALSDVEIDQLYNDGQPFPDLAPQVAADNLQPADFIYHYLLNEVPENWIPFVPVRLNNELVLQRGKMQRNLPHLLASLRYIKPMGTLLNEHTQSNPNLYFLKEEEVPRAGITVTKRFQRTRWIDGQIYTWLGRQKKAGNGEVNSNLQFDHLEAFEQD
jgi:hypothetical protein